MPRLVQLYGAGESGYADEPMLDLTLKSAVTRCRSVNGACVAGWMCSEASPAKAADYLARSGTMFDVSKGRQRYLPVFEPYRMALLADDPQAESFLQRWLGPFIHWMFIDTCGTVQTYLGTPTAQPAVGQEGSNERSSRRKSASRQRDSL